MRPDKYVTATILAVAILTAGFGELERAGAVADFVGTITPEDGVPGADTQMTLSFNLGAETMTTGDRISLSVPDRFEDFGDITASGAMSIGSVIGIHGGGSWSFETTQRKMFYTLGIGESTLAGENITIVIGGGSDNTQLKLPASSGVTSVAMLIISSTGTVKTSGYAFLAHDNTVQVGVSVKLPPVTGLNYTADCSVVELTWDEHPGIIDGYVIGYRQTGTGAYQYVSVTPKTNTGYTLTNLALGDYELYIIAVYRGIESSPASITFSVVCITSTVDLIIRARPEKRDLYIPNNYGLDNMLIMYDPGVDQVVSTITSTLDDTGYVMIPNAPVPAGTGYIAFLKGRSHLAEKLEGVNIASGATVELNYTEGAPGNFGPYRLLAGDVQGTWPGTKDNLVDILDVSAVDANFNSYTYEDADLNNDFFDVVDVLDMSITIANFNKMGVTLP